MPDSQKLVSFLAFATKVLAILTLVGIVIGALALLSGSYQRLPVTVSGSGLDLGLDPQAILGSPTFKPFLLVTILLAACKLTILFQLHKVLLTVLKSSPFVIENAHRIRIIAFVFFANTFLNVLNNALEGKLAQEMLQLPIHQTSISLRFDPSEIGIGLLILVLAEIFRLGVTMKEEQDLTI